DYDGDYNRHNSDVEPSFVSAYSHTLSTLCRPALLVALTSLAPPALHWPLLSVGCTVGLVEIKPRGDHMAQKRKAKKTKRKKATKRRKRRRILGVPIPQLG